METHSTVTGAWYQYGHWFTAQVGPEHTLELPAHGSAVTTPVGVQGWAIDGSAPSGTGVGAISMWAYPNVGSGQASYWIGLATYGGNRADVAASHGERFRHSGYTASTAGVVNGPNMFWVSAQSTHTQAWTSKYVTIYVNTPTVPLTIDRPGTGTGGVTAAGLTCVGGSTTQAVPCGASYPLHTGVTLTAVPDANSTFAGWGGACTGTSTCQVTLSMARFVTATFSKLPDTIATRYYHTDVVGSVRAITDEAGATVIRHDYRPFGENTNPMTGDPIRFAGKELDPETGQQYFNARYYRNTWGRFSAVDPLHVGAAMTDPQQWNRYAYARNNPLAYGDPTGLATCSQTSSGIRCNDTSSTSSYLPTRPRPGGGGGGAGYLSNDSVWMELGENLCRWSAVGDPNVGYGEIGPCVTELGGGYYGADYTPEQGVVPTATTAQTPNEVPNLPKPPPGKGPNGNLIDNEWVPGKGTDNRGTRFDPKFPVPGQSQPNVSWDDANQHWDHNDGNRNRRRFLPNGVEVDHYNRPIRYDPLGDLVPRVVSDYGPAAVVIYLLISEGSRILFPPRNLVPVP